jgi:hypothetical protein
MADTPEIKTLRAEIDELRRQIRISELRRQVAELEAKLAGRSAAPGPRPGTAPPPPMGGLTNAAGNFVRRQMARETELVQSPEQAAIAARRRNRALAAPAPLPLGWGNGVSGPAPAASPTGDLTGRGPAFQTKPIHLSGRSAD